MTEIINIFLQLLIFLFVFSFPFNNFLLNKVGLKSTETYDIFFINFIFFSTICLIFSITNISSKLLLYSFILFGFIFFIKNFFTNRNIYLNFIFLIFAGLNILIYFEIASFPILNWDGLATWSLKMNNFYFGQNYQNLENITYQHQPHLGSYLWALFLNNSFLKIEYFGRLFYVFIFLCSVFSLISEINKNKNFNLLIFLILLIFYLTYDFYLFGGYQEYLLFSLILFTGKLLYNFSKKSKVNFYEIIIFSLILNLIIWSKQEGLAYVIILQFVFLTLKQITIHQKIFSLLFLVGLILLKVNYSFNHLLEDPHFNFNEIFNFNLNLLLYKFLFISKHILISFIKYPIWLLIFTIYFYLFLTKNLKKNFLDKIYLFGFLNLGLIYFVFLTTTSDFEWLVKVTLDRMVFQTTGFYLILLLIFFDNKILK